MTHSVYWIRCADHTDMTSQGYIGVSVNAKRRFTEHAKSNNNRHLMFAIQKYGWNNLIKSEILIAKEEYCLDIERKLRPLDNVGWNLIAGGGKPPVSYGHKRAVGNTWNKGTKHSLERRQQRSELNKLRLQDPVVRARFAKAMLGRPSPNIGRKASPETIEKLRVAHLGKPSGKKGIPNSLEAIAKLKETFKANPWTCPHCSKTGFNKGSGNRWHFDNCKHKELTT